MIIYSRMSIVSVCVCVFMNSFIYLKPTHKQRNENEIEIENVFRVGARQQQQLQRMEQDAKQMHSFMQLL